jgi:hypothetical protein
VFLCFNSHPEIIRQALLPNGMQAYQIRAYEKLHLLFQSTVDDSLQYILFIVHLLSYNDSNNHLNQKEKGYWRKRTLLRRKV